MAVALDSSAVVGFLDRGDAFHAEVDERIRELVVSGQELFVSIVTYAEVLTGTKLGHHDEGAVRGFFCDLVSEVGPIDVEVAERAAELRAEVRSLKMPEALIFAAADIHAAIDRILCGDGVAAKVDALLDCDVEQLRGDRRS